MNPPTGPVPFVLKVATIVVVVAGYVVYIGPALNELEPAGSATLMAVLVILASATRIGWDDDT